ncbi:MAG: hypothetical protein IJK46_04915 [Prevotella sp.]|nr:hypothetical protein [Prevotella sp.]
MTDFIVKAVKIDGLNWPLRALLQSLDSPELGETEWWRRMAVMQNAAARAGDQKLLGALDNKKEERYGSRFEAPEVVTLNNLPALSVEESVKRWFQDLNQEKRQEVLKHAMGTLLETPDNDSGKKLFSKKQHWMAVYMVLRDRLGLLTKHNEFHTYAAKITPDTCPAKLRISSSTMTNFSKTVPEGQYFKIKNNPFHEHCSVLWTIIKDIYYSKVFTNE